MQAAGGADAAASRDLPGRQRRASALQAQARIAQSARQIRQSVDVDVRQDERRLCFGHRAREDFKVSPFLPSPSGTLVTTPELP